MLPEAKQLLFLYIELFSIFHLEICGLSDDDSEFKISTRIDRFKFDKKWEWWEKMSTVGDLVV